LPDKTLNGLDEEETILKKKGQVQAETIEKDCRNKVEIIRQKSRDKVNEEKLVND
jgi:hypothetical protein